MPNQEGLGRSTFVPWQYIARRSQVNYQADLPGFAKASYDGLLADWRNATGDEARKECLQAMSA